MRIDTQLSAPPTIAAPAGTLAQDMTNDVVYFNKDGTAGGWAGLNDGVFDGDVSIAGFLNLGTPSVPADAPGEASFAGDVFTDGTLTVSALTAGRVIFANTAGLLDDDSLFVWDGAKLGVGIAVPKKTLHCAKDGLNPSVLLLENSRPNTDGSIDETVRTTFGFGGKTNAVLWVVDKEADYTILANESSGIGIHTRQAGNTLEAMRIGADGTMTLARGDLILDIGDVTVTLGDTTLGGWLDVATALAVGSGPDASALADGDAFFGQLGGNSFLYTEAAFAGTWSMRNTGTTVVQMFASGNNSKPLLWMGPVGDLNEFEIGALGASRWTVGTTASGIDLFLQTNATDALKIDGTTQDVTVNAGDLDIPLGSIGIGVASSGVGGEIKWSLNGTQSGNLTAMTGSLNWIGLWAGGGTVGAAGDATIIGNTNNGDTIVNARTGRTVSLRINNGTQMTIDGTTVTIATNDLTVASGDTTLGGFLNVGMTTDASVVGGFSTGLLGGARMTFNPANARLNLYDTSGIERLRFNPAVNQLWLINADITLESGRRIHYATIGGGSESSLRLGSGIHEQRVSGTLVGSYSSTAYTLSSGVDLIVTLGDVDIPAGFLNVGDPATLANTAGELAVLRSLQAGNGTDAAPNESIMVTAASTAASVIAARVAGKAASFGAGSSIGVLAYDNSARFTIFGDTRANIVAGSLGSGTEVMRFNTSHQVAISNKLRVGSTTGPSATLDVTGTAAISGDTTLGGDLAHTGAKLGHYATAPIVKQTGVAVTAAGVHAALVNLGLIAA